MTLEIFITDTEFAAEVAPSDLAEWLLNLEISGKKPGKDFLKVSL